MEANPHHSRTTSAEESACNDAKGISLGNFHRDYHTASEKNHGFHTELLCGVSDRSRVWILKEKQNEGWYYPPV